MSTIVADESETSSTPGVPLDPLPTELQFQIASYLDNKTLCIAIRVNSTWFDRIIDLLWHTTSLEKLSSTSDAFDTNDRRQIYACRVRMGTLKATVYDPDSMLQALSFEAIQHLEIQTLCATEALLTPFLNPTLRSLTLSESCYLTPAVLIFLRNCTRLHTLVFGDAVKTYPAESFLEFLREHRSLRSLKFGSFVRRSRSRWPEVDRAASKDDFNSESAEVLLRRGDLTSLSMRFCSEKDHTLAPLGSQFSAPLPSNTQLQLLTLSGDTTVVAAFLSVATVVMQHLTLSVSSTSGEIFDRLSSLTSLINLSLRWMHYNEPLTISSLDAIRVSHNLKFLYLSEPKNDQHSASSLAWLTDDYFTGWISHLPHLRTLQLEMSCRLTKLSLLAISRSCPDLLSCTLGWRHDLDDWTSLTRFAPLFPRMKTLQLGTVEEVSFAAPLLRDMYPVIMSTMGELFPDLEIFHVDRMAGSMPVRNLNRITGMFLNERQAMLRERLGTTQ